MFYFVDNQVEEAMKEFNNLNSPSLQSNSLPFDQNYLLKYNEEMSNLSLDDSEEKIENNNVLGTTPLTSLIYLSIYSRDVEGLGNPKHYLIP